MVPEILAPVGSSDCLAAAVYSGADAIYFGADEFNARRNAGNFDRNAMKNALEFCRLHGVKSYLTLNILIKDSELKKAVDLAFFAYQNGIDGVIVQDLGLAALLNKTYPEIPLHASTQLSVHSPAALTPLKELGFKRVVPAREMSEKELIMFCKEASRLNMEVEVFVHGALCMCLSGQCYFSAHLGGRSANRGLCAGTCRLPFSAEDGTGFDLSLKDLSLVEKVDSLKNMGVCSLKIEGRMKNAEYVASAVHTLKSALENKEICEKDKRMLERVFSRSGFTDGYFTDKTGKAMFGVRTEQDRAASKEVLNSIHNLYRRPLQKIPMKFFVQIKENLPVTVTAECEGFKAKAVISPPEKAINREITEAGTVAALSKLGGTPYFADTVECDIDKGLCVSVSALNGIKKEITDRLTLLRTAVKPVEKKELIIENETNRKKIKGYFLRFANLEQIPKLRDNITGYSLPAEVILSTDISLLPLAKSKNLSPAAELPRGAEDDTKTLATLKSLKEKGIKTVVCSNIAAISLARNMGFEIFGGFGLNLFNSQSLKTAEQIGVKSGVISPELSLSQTETLSSDAFESYFYCYGRFPLMLTKNCPVKNGVGCAGKKDYCKIIDRKGEIFPVICRNGYCEILNSRPTNIADSVCRIAADGGYLYFSTESAREAEKVIEGFENGIITSKPFTRGLSKNGVL